MRAGKKPSFLTLFFGGILPVVAFTIVEDNFGIVWGTVAGMIFGIGEITYEKIFLKKISPLTLSVNALLLLLGSISILLNDGIWFKLQPAIIEAGFVLFLWISFFRKKPLLPQMAKMQGVVLPPQAYSILTGMTFRLGLFFAIHACIATWAAFKWTTEQWAWLKGAGLTVSFIAYFGLEFLIIKIMNNRRL